MLSREKQVRLIYFYSDDWKMLEKYFGRMNWNTYLLMETVPVAWMWENHPLSQKKESVTADEISRWPVISYEALSPGTAILSGNIDFGHTFSKKYLFVIEFRYCLYFGKRNGNLHFRKRFSERKKKAL